MIATIAIALLLIAFALWLILAALIGITPREALRLLGGAIWHLSVFGLIVGLILFALVNRITALIWQ